MKYACHSCRALYAIPDERVSSAGAEGLRVRCSRCRAIMAVCLADEGEPGADDDEWGARDDVTKPLGKRRRAGATSASDPALQVVPTEVGVRAPLPAPPPASLSASGFYRPLPGVDRAVTGLHMPSLQKARPGREWYAAFGGRARGPFSEEELRYLAAEGRVRASTLVWRPGFSTWSRVKGEAGAEGDAPGWLRQAVRERKLKERLVAQKASSEHGIVRIHLDDFSVMPQTPPPLPPVQPSQAEPPRSPEAPAARPPQIFVGRRLPGLAADRVFGAPGLGEPKAPRAALPRRRPRRQRALALLACALWAGLALLAVAYALPTLEPALSSLLEQFTGRP